MGLYCSAYSNLAAHIRISIFPSFVLVRSFMDQVLPQLDLLKYRKETTAYKNEVRT